MCACVYVRVRRTYTHTVRVHTINAMEIVFITTMHTYAHL